MPKVVSIVGKSNSGKTLLLKKLIPVFKKKGFKIGVIKNSTHKINIDHEGKDSWVIKQAGADSVAVYSSTQVALFKDLEKTSNPEELTKLYFNDVDLVLTEGFKEGKLPKIEVFRKEAHKEPLCLGDKSLIAFVSDSKDIEIGDVPLFKPENIKELAEFIERRYL